MKGVPTAVPETSMDGLGSIGACTLGGVAEGVRDCPKDDGTSPPDNAKQSCGRLCFLTSEGLCNVHRPSVELPLDRCAMEIHPLLHVSY